VQDVLILGLCVTKSRRHSSSRPACPAPAPEKLQGLLDLIEQVLPSKGLG